MDILEAEIADLEEVLKLQHLAYRSEAEIYNDYTIPPLVQNLKELEMEVQHSMCLVIKQNNKVVASVRARQDDDICHVGKLIVHPDFQCKGYGSRLMSVVEERHEDARIFEVFTGHRSEKNLYLYSRLGYERFSEKKLNDNVRLVFLRKTL